MTHDTYMDATSKLAIQALVLELDEAVRSAAECAMQPAVAQLQQAARRLDGSEEALKQDLGALAQRLPENMHAQLELLVTQASRPEWRDEIAHVREQLGALGDALSAVESSLADLHRRDDEPVRAHLHDQLRALEQLLDAQQAAPGQLRAALEQALASRAPLEESRFREGLDAAVGMQAERFGQLAGMLGALHENLNHLHGEQRAQHDRLFQAVETLAGRLAAVASGVEEALGQFQGLHATLDRRLGAEEGRESLRAIARAVDGVEDRVDAAIARVERAEEGLLQGVLDSEKRLSANVRQVMAEVVAERVPEAVAQGQRALGERMGGMGEDVQALRSELSQLADESRTRHDLVLRMLESMSGRLILDMEAQNKNAWFLDRLRANSRWQLAASVVGLVVLVGAVAALGLSHAGLLGRF